MKIALLQLAVLEKNKEANVAHGLQLVRENASDHDVLVLPEVWTTGYSLGHLDTPRFWRSCKGWQPSMNVLL